MTSKVCYRIKSLVVLLAGTVVIALLAPIVAMGAEAPVKLIVSNHVGWDVNKTKAKEAAPQAERNVCTVASGDECAPGAENSEAGGLTAPEGIALNNDSTSAEHGDVYVADTGNQRVQVFSPAGAFVFMFGWDVNKTKEEAGAPQAELNVCTAASKDVCQAGAAGGAAGQFSSPTSVTVEPATGNVYVEDVFNWRVQEFTATGEFVLMLGKDVNETTGENLCTASSHDICKAGEESGEGSTEVAAFKFSANHGSLLAVGGPEGLLYVGDQQRVERFTAGGVPKGEIELSSISSAGGSSLFALAVDPLGDVYVAYEVNSAQNVITELGPKSEILKRFELSPRQPHQVGGVELQIRALTLDPAGSLTVAEREVGNSIIFRGSLYEVGATTLHPLSEFVSEIPTEFGPKSALSLAFNGETDAMYAVGGAEFVAYVATHSGSLTTEPAVCKAGADNETDATFECELRDEANPWKIPATEVWFQWGKTLELSSRTGSQSLATVETPLQVSSMLTGLLPNETYYYRPVGEDQNVEKPELFGGETGFVTTEAVPPRIVGEPSTLHVGPFSVDMFAQLNPENMSTTYEFQYGPCEDLASCPGTVKTTPLESPAYGVLGTTVEVVGLLPSTLYHFRLVAESTSGKATSSTGAFTTAPGPAVTAETRGPSAVGTTSAVLAGVVNPDGQAATYTYELGRYNGGATQFGVVFSGPAGAGSLPVETTLAVSGLQPGTVYAYRVAAHSGDGSVQGEAATGATLTFTTEGLPAVFTPSVSPLLVVPPVPFPVVKKPLTNAQKLAAALKLCKRERKKQRASCEHKAHKRYPTSKKK